MSTIRNWMLSCVSNRTGGVAPAQIVKFNTPLSEAFKHGLPSPIIDILVHIAHEGVTVPSLFRRPGSTSDMRIIMKHLSEGRPINLKQYNFYTLASVLKQFLLHIPGGLFGREIEADFLVTLLTKSKLDQYDQINAIIKRLTPAVQHLLSLLFGTFFRVANHIEYSTMSTEALAKSVAGSLFHTCAHSKESVEKASQFIQILIENFAVPSLFGSENINYFCQITDTGIRVKERYLFDELGESLTSSPQTIAKCHKSLQACSSLSAPEVSTICENANEFSEAEGVVQNSNQCGSLHRFDSVKRRQLALMEKKRNWFEGTASTTTTTTTSGVSSSLQVTDSSAFITQSSPSSPYRQLDNSKLKVLCVERHYKGDSHIKSSKL